MSDALPLPTADVTFAIQYEKFTSPTYNREFKGAGTLTIQPSGPAFVFAGRPRKTLARKPTQRYVLGADINNVTVDGRSVSLQFFDGQVRLRTAPFVFFARTPEEAKSIAALLPATKTDDFEAANNFLARLQTLPAASTPWTSVTNIIIALNLVVFVGMATFHGTGWFEASTLPYLRFGANNGAATTAGEWWRLVTSMFMHFGTIHVLLNMWALFQAGHFLEKLQGRWLFTLTYFASGLAGGFASILWHRDQAISAGASGAVFGVFGAIYGFLLHQKQALPREVYRSMIRWTHSSGQEERSI